MQKQKSNKALIEFRLSHPKIIIFYFGAIVCIMNTNVGNKNVNSITPEGLFYPQIRFDRKVCFDEFVMTSFGFGPTMFMTQEEKPTTYFIGYETTLWELMQHRYQVQRKMKDTRDIEANIFGHTCFRKKNTTCTIVQARSQGRGGGATGRPPPPPTKS